MDAFMGHLLAAIQADGDDAMRVFPSEAANSVMLAYAERLATDVVSIRSEISSAQKSLVLRDFS